METTTALYTRQEFAKLLRLSVETIDGWAKKGFIKPIKLGRAVRYTREEFERIIGEAKNESR